MPAPLTSIPLTGDPTKPLGQRVPRDADGYWVIGDPTLGCPYCGSVTAVEGRKGGKTIVYHPSTECCKPAVERQLRWRTAELARLGNQPRSLELMRDVREEIRLLRIAKDAL